MFLRVILLPTYAGKLAEDVLSTVLHATAPPAGAGHASTSSPASGSKLARPVPRVLERALRNPEFDNTRRGALAGAVGGASTSAAGKRDAAWMVRASL